MAEEMGNVDSAIEASQKPVVSREKEIGEDAERPKGPVGLDIGTSHIVMAQNKGKNIHTVKQLNAFFTIPYSKFTKKILVENEVTFYLSDPYSRAWWKNYAGPDKNTIPKELLAVIQATVDADTIPVMDYIMGPSRSLQNKTGEQ